MASRIDWDFLVCLLVSIVSFAGTAWYFDPLLWQMW